MKSWICLALLITGCDKYPNEANQKQAEWAVAQCETRGGLNYFETVCGSEECKSVRATCKNGTQISGVVGAN